MHKEELVSITADIVAAHVGNNNVSIGDVGRLIASVHAALAGLGEAPPAAGPEQKKALVSVRASIKPEHLVCMECGSQQKMLKRHLAVAHGVTPQQYRANYDLPASYPMSAPNYSERRRALARAAGLGRRPERGRNRSGPGATSAGPVLRGRKRK